MSKEVQDRLKELKNEDFIWLIYIGIIFMSWYSNSLERKYFLNKDLKSKTKYREITIGIFIVLVIVYIYFFIDSYKGLKNINKCDDKQKQLIILSFLASLLILISGILFLYIAIKDEDLNVELAFN